ncbi:ABC transporter ATP-binding protein [Marivibrio halodurans]|uniref:ABC transporter ATP-binding protein n=1 Tax=Marivibrio halodurans TaxID=2039722 RepID=UPI0031BAAD52
MTAEAEAILRVDDLTVDYGLIRAVNGVSFEVAQGAIVSLVGSNGAGKTTTMKALSGLVPRAGGAVRFAGAPLDGVTPDGRVARGLAHVPEGRRVFPRMTVRENLLLGAYLRGRDPGVVEDLDRVCEMFPILAARRQQLAGTLSGGEQQMLAIARALMSRPKLLLMDEPSMGLAPQMVDLILEKIVEIRASGATVLLVEQNAVEAIRLSDVVYVLRLGAVIHRSAGRDMDESLLKALYLGHDI